MIYLFDIDGTICEGWYGKQSPMYYKDEIDAAMRAFSSDCYEYTKPLPQAINFITKLRKERETGTKIKIGVLSLIHSSREWEQKKAFVNRNFLYDLNSYGNTSLPLFDADMFFGAISQDDKYCQMKRMMDIHNSNIIYFDDNMEFLIRIQQKEMSKNTVRNHILPMHSSCMLTREPHEVLAAYQNMYRSFSLNNMEN